MMEKYNRDVVKYNREIIFVFAALIIALTALFHYFSAKYKNVILERAGEDLKAVAALKTNQIAEWRELRITDGRVLLANIPAMNVIKTFLADPKNQKLREEIKAWAEAIASARKYKNLYIANIDGRFIVGAKENSSDEYECHSEEINQAIETKQAILTNLHQSPENPDLIHWSLVAPIIKDAKVIALVIAVLDPHHYLYPLIKKWPTSSSTSETLLVRRIGDEIVFLNDLRHQKNTAFKLRFPINRTDLPAAMALSGKSGIFKGKDYRGTPVLAAVNKIPGTDWGIVAKTDLDEIYKPVKELDHFTLLFLGFFTLLAALGLMAIWRARLTVNYKRMYEGELQRTLLLQRIQYLIEHANDIILLVDENDNIIEANLQAVRSYGYSLSELMEMKLSDLEVVCDDSRKRLMTENPIEQSGRIFETAHKRKNGSFMPVELSAKTITLGGKAYFQIIGRDITERLKARQTLKESEERFRSLFESMNEIVALHEFVYDDKGEPVNYRIIDVNPAFCTELGLPKEKAVGSLATSLYGTDEAPYLKDYAQVALGGKPISFETYFPPMDKYFHISAYSFQKGKFATATLDVTAEKKAQLELGRKEKLLAELVEISPVAMIIASAETNEIQFCNSAFVSLFGYRKEELGKLDVLCEKVFNNGRCHSLLEKSEGQAPDAAPTTALIETAAKTKDGAERFVQICAAFGADKRFVFFIDLTMRKAYENEISKLNRLYAVLSQVNQMIVRSKTKNDLFREVCRIAVEFGGFKLAWIGEADPATGDVLPAAQAGGPADYLEGIKVSVLDIPEGRGPSGTAMRENRIFICNDFHGSEETGPWKEKARIAGFKSVGAFPILSEGKVCASLMLYSDELNYFDSKEINLLDEVVKDINFGLDGIAKEERKIAAEEALRASRQEALFFSEILSNSDQPFTVGYEDGTLGMHNEAFRRLCGYSAEELSSMNFLKDLTAPQWIDKEMSMLEKVRQTGEPVRYEKEYICKNGQIIPVELFVHGVKDADGKIDFYYAFITDITYRKQAEAKIRENEKFLSTVFDAIPDMIFVKEAQTLTFVRLNKAGEEIFGAKYEEVAGKNDYDFFPKEEADFFTSKDYEVLSSKKPLDIPEEPIKSAKGDLILHTQKIPILDENGEPKYLLGISEDITMQKQAEAFKEQIKAKMEHQQRLKSIGTLASGVAHEINNPINIIMNYALLISEELQKETDAYKWTQNILSESERISTIVKNLLSFSRQENQTLAPENINDLISRTLTLLTRGLQKEHIRLNLDLADNLPEVYCKGQQIQQVLMNLISNARYALNKRYPEYDDNKIISITSEAFFKKERNYVRITIEDKGVGISAEIQKRIFDPFFTTKTRDEGTGLGLSISHGIITDHKGTLACVSEEMNYTKFIIELPADFALRSDTV